MFVRSETHRLAQYLVTLRALPREGAPVQVLVVAPPGQRATFEQVLVSDARLVFRTIDSAEALDTIKLRRVPEQASAEALFLHLAATQPPREQFASRQDRRRYFVWQLQRGLLAAGALGFAACTFYAGWKWSEVMELRDAAAAQRSEARTAAERYERITASFPVTQTSTENLKVAVVEFRRLAEQSATPERSFMHVSQILNRFPQMEIESVGWSVARPVERGVKPGATPVPSAAGALGAPEPRGNMAEFIELAGRVNATQRNDYRGITAQVQGFASALVGDGYELARTQLPFDITSEGVLTGDIGTSADTGEAPRFTVTLSRRLP